MRASFSCYVSQHKLNPKAATTAGLQLTLMALCKRLSCKQAGALLSLTTRLLAAQSLYTSRVVTNQFVTGLKERALPSELPLPTAARLVPSCHSLAICTYQTRQACLPQPRCSSKHWQKGTFARLKAFLALPCQTPHIKVHSWVL